jgi:hypothetical protein
MNTEWRVTLPDGTTGTVVGAMSTGRLIIRRDQSPPNAEMCWPEELTTDTGKLLGYGFAAGLPIQGDDT